MYRFADRLRRFRTFKNEKPAFSMMALGRMSLLENCRTGLAEKSRFDMRGPSCLSGMCAARLMRISKACFRSLREAIRKDSWLEEPSATKSGIEPMTCTAFWGNF